MTFVTIPACLFTDRRIKPNHIRVFAAVAMFRGIAPITALDIARETGIDRSDVYRAFNDLIAFKLIDEKTRTVRYIERIGEIPSAGKSPEIPLPPDGPLSLFPDTPKPKPPLTPHPPTNHEARARATRLPEDWQPDAADLAYAATVELRDIAAVIEDFRDYWHARAGPDAAKQSWPKTWKRWCRTTKQKQEQQDARSIRPGAVQEFRPVPVPEPPRSPAPKPPPGWRERLGGR